MGARFGYLSIPLNGFAYNERYWGGEREYTFNSIEWIPT